MVVIVLYAIWYTFNSEQAPFRGPVRQDLVFTSGKKRVQIEWIRFVRPCAVTALRLELIFKPKTGTAESSSLRRIACDIALVILIVSIVTPTITPARSLQTARMQLSPFSAGGASSYTSVGECVVDSTLLPTILRCSLNPSDDAYVDNLAPTQAFGDLPVLIVQDSPSIPKSRNYAYLKFNLQDSLPSDILLSHAKPVNTILWLYVRYIGGSFNASIDIYYVPSNDWNESSLTWNNRPSHDTITYAARDVTTNGTWYEWNASAAVALAINGATPVSLVAAPPSNAWRNYVWFDSKEHTATKGTTSPKLNLVFVEPYLNLVTQIPYLPITIGDRTFVTDSSGRLAVYLPWGNYNIAVPETFPKGEGAREQFVGWSDNVTEATRLITLGNNLTLSANYQTQYRLDVNSPYGSTSGAGWYFMSVTANASIHSTLVLAEGLLGLLGVRHVFDHWVGDCTGSQPICTVMMNGPKNVLAVWRDDYTITGIEMVSLIAITAYLFVFRKRKRRRATRRRSKR